MPSQKTKTKCIFLTSVSFSLGALFTTLQCLIFCQLLFTIFSPFSVSVHAVYIFPLRLSPKYYIPGLLEPPKSRSAHQLNSLHKALKYLHTSKSAAEVTNAFLRKISEDSESSESSPTSASAILTTSTTTGATIATRKTTRNSGGNNQALPLNEQITGKFADQLRSSKKIETEFEEKLVLIVFKLPVKRTRERQRRYKRQRPSLQFYQRSADPNSMVTASSSRTMSIGNKIRSWWEGTTGNTQQRPTSSTPKFQPTYKFTYSEGPVPYNSERPWAFRSTTARTSNSNSNSFLHLDKFFWKSTAPPGKRPSRPGGGPPPPNPTSGRGLLPSPSTTPFLSFGDYYFNGPGCQPRGPKLILCTTDRIEHLSNLLEKFMHYHEKNNLQYAKQSAVKFVDDDEDDYDDSRGDDSNYKYRVLGKNNKNKKKKPKGYHGLTPKKHPSVVVVAMNRDEEIDDLEDHHEDDDEFMAHRSESIESIVEDHDDSSHEHDDDHHDEKDPLLMFVKGGSSGKRPEVIIQGSKGKNKSPRTKRKLKRSHNHHNLSPPFSFSEEMKNYDYVEKEGNRDRYFYFLQDKKKNLDDDRDHYKRNQLDERIRETEAEYKRLNMLLELVKKYQELA